MGSMKIGRIAVGALALALLGASPVSGASGPLHPTSAATHRTVGRTTVARPAVTVRIDILTPTMDFQGGPEFSPSNISLPANALVRMIITNYDNGASPAPGHTRIAGVAGGAIRVDGKAVRRVAAADIAHTFTIEALGLNVPIEAAPAGGKVVVSFEFRTHGPGLYEWQCFALCGNDIAGWGYPMTGSSDMMQGRVFVGSSIPA